jgi:MoaA/NifB/PqqE/SkfB family radical SAM enzyme
MPGLQKYLDGFGYLRNHGLLWLSEKTRKVLWKPNAVAVDITARCSCRCMQCDIWKSEETEELSREQWEALIVDLRDWLGHYGVTIGGGEPLIRNDMLDLCRFAIRNHATVNLLTNGMHFNNRVIREICDMGMQRLAISIDGLEDTHDYIRGIPGLFARIREAVEEFRRHSRRPLITVETIVTSRSLPELESLVQWAESKELKGVLFHPLAQNFGAREKDPTWYEHSELWVRDLELLDSTVDRLLEMQQKGRAVVNAPSQLRAFKQYYRDPTVAAMPGRKCDAGKSSVQINHRGDVIFCYPFGAVGNIKETPLSQLWCSSRAREMHRQIRACTLNCSLLNCYFGGGLFEKIRRYIRYH